MKRIIMVVCLLMFATSLVACNNKEENEFKHPVKNNVPVPGIVAGEVKTELIENQIGVYHLQYILKNQTESVKKFRFNDGLKFDYIIYDEKGNKVYQHSENVMSIQAIQEIELKQGQEEIVGRVEFQNINPGTYNIEVWLNSTDNNDYKISKAIVLK